MVQTGRNEFERRYRREYLTSEKFRGFDEALVRLMELLELPGVGQDSQRHALACCGRRTGCCAAWRCKALSRPEELSRPEQPVLEDAFNGWLDLLRKEAARRADVASAVGARRRRASTPAAWPSRRASASSSRCASFQSSEADEVDRTARAIYEQLEKKPAVLNTLRGGKFALDVAAIGRHRSRPAASAGRTSSSSRWSPR